MNQIIQLNTYIEIGSSIGMLALSLGATVYILVAKNRIISFTNMMIFLTFIISFLCSSFLAIHDYKHESYNH